MRPWRDVQKTHVSEEQKHRKILSDYKKLDRAIEHFLHHIHQRGEPAPIRLPAVGKYRNLRGWLHEARLTYRDTNGLKCHRTHRLIIEQNGMMWKEESYSPPGHDYDGGWSGLTLRIRKDNRYVFDGDPRYYSYGAFESSITPIQLLLVELCRKHNIPIPPD